MIIHDIIFCENNVRGLNGERFMVVGGGPDNIFGVNQEDIPSSLQHARVPADLKETRMLKESLIKDNVPLINLQVTERKDMEPETIYILCGALNSLAMADPLAQGSVALHHLAFCELITHFTMYPYFNGMSSYETVSAQISTARYTVIEKQRAMHELMDVTLDKWGKLVSAVAKLHHTSSSIYDHNPKHVFTDINWSGVELASARKDILFILKALTEHRSDTQS